MKHISILLLALFSAIQAAQAKDLDVNLIKDLKSWQNLSATSEGEATFSSGKTISFTYPDGQMGWHRKGLEMVHDRAGYWRDQYGIRFDLYSPVTSIVVGTAAIKTAPNLLGSEYVVDTFTSNIAIAGKGWHTVTIPIESFSYEKSRPAIIEAIKTFELTIESATTNDEPFRIRAPRLIKADRVHLHSAIRSESAERGKDVVYQLELTNHTDQAQAITLSRIVQGREVMDTRITPNILTIAPDASESAEIRVTVSERVPPGGHEKQLIQAIANGVNAGQIEYITLSRMEHPYIMHTPERWDDIFEKIETVDWAKKAAQEYLAKADKWQVPSIKRDNISNRTNTPYLYHSDSSNDFFDACVAYKLSGNIKYAQKAALYLRQMADPEIGYPRTNQVNQNNLVKEGAMFQYFAMGYDIIYDSGALTDEDHQNIEKTFRLFHKVINQHIAQSTIGNWQVAEALGCIYTGLVIQDMAVVERFMHGPGGFYDQITHGTMGDGWWFECSIGYNAWVSREFTQLALALQPWGTDILHASFPASYSKEYNILGDDVEKRKRDYYGMPFHKFGPVHKPYVKITDMWEAMIPYIDYEGVMFALNDSTEKKFEGLDYEVAYFAYKDTKYAAIIKNAAERDLLYGLELPEDTPELGKGSAYSDNVGVAMLRSTQEDPRERIQAVLKYGTHGGYHGHFDRAGLNSLMRYGRSFYNPEHIWYSYPNFMYKFFVQTSLPHNMVVVDMKQQEPVESDRLLFAEGEMIQATAVETNARWSNPPYGGIYYDDFQRPFQEKTWHEGRHVPQPENEPKYGSIGEYGERITQRRLMAVTDDYVVIADHLQGNEDHIFDCLFNIKGFQGIEADSVTHTRHTEQMHPDPVLAAQFITDCNWYDTTGTTKVSFETQFGKGADNAGTRIYGKPGSLFMDVYSAWPKEREVMIGTLPEAHGVNRKFWYSVIGDGKTLAEGKFGAWVLGRDEIDVSVEGVKTLTLQTKADFNNNAPKTLFWGNPVLITETGETIDLNLLKLKYDQIDTSPKSGTDYQGGPVKIAGRRFESTLPANPFKANEDGTINVSLKSLNASRFQASVGGDYPLGDETWRRKSLSFRTQGTETQYLTVIEPFEKDSVVKSVNAHSAREIEVMLKDGRKHILTINNLEQGSDISVSIKEFKSGKLLREETIR
ncbi:alginate lyase family protein [Pelagicoccus enzymogenes]|uniref:alginate lyase family protein n=1 Tax=Pelagicoccus enzymogenes TaxID=2773457 RepID=UPI0028107659|nr:alginate lyase family protein [Pelagicoccus enzymogenes]MDQ8197894.1 alginate lyase family protein [Pelagicoccus enzymogenes]